jgi:hypothetical protein
MFVPKMTPSLEKTTCLSTSNSTRKRRMHHLRGLLEQKLTVKLVHRWGWLESKALLAVGWFGSGTSLTI